MKKMNPFLAARLRSAEKMEGGKKGKKDKEGPADVKADLAMLKRKKK